MNGRGLVFLGIAVFFVSTTRTRADETSDKVGRLRAMSRDERDRLAKNLAQFDALTPKERDSIRAIDAKLSELEPEARARYLAVLRRYSVFYRNLPEAKRRTLDQTTDISRKLELVKAYRTEQKPSPDVLRRYADGLQISQLSPLRLRPLARQLVVFFALDPVKDARERAEFAAMKKVEDRQAFVQKAMRKPEIRSRLREEAGEFRAAQATVLEQLAKVEDELLKAEIQKYKKNSAKAEDAVAKVKEGFPKRRPDWINKLDEVQVLHDLDAQPVDPSNLERFESSLPTWARESLDPLPPDAARRRLKVLYRLVFPAPEEISAGKTASPPPPANVRPSAPASSGANPF